MRKTLIALAVSLVLAMTGFTAAANADKPPKDPGKPTFVTFCHIAGLASDPANSVTLTLPENAVYGQAGHFNENGTTQAGHENDYLGPCITDEPTDPVTPTTPVTPTDPVDPTTPVEPTPEDPEVEEPDAPERIQPPAADAPERIPAEVPTAVDAGL